MSIATNKKVLVPLATLLAAGAVAVESGATFTSRTGNSVSAVTSGTLLQSNSKENQAIFDLTNLTPVYTGVLGGMTDRVEADLGTVAPGVANTFRFTVHLAEDAPNSQQDKAAGAGYQWDSVQLGPDTTDQ
jgi:spore coat-associated protein N